MTFRNWADAGYQAKNLDGRESVELLSSDARFGYVFTAFAASPFPIQIWELDAGRLRDVTRLFPGQVELDAKRLWRTYLEHRRRDDVRGVLAAWQADQYLLGREDAGWLELERALERGDLVGPNGFWPTGLATCGRSARSSSRRATPSLARGEPVGVTYRRHPRALRCTAVRTPLTRSREAGKESNDQSCASACVRARAARRRSARTHPPSHRPRDHRGQPRPRAGGARRHPHARRVGRAASPGAHRAVRRHRGRARDARHHVLPRRRPRARARGAAPPAAGGARDSARLPARGEDLHPRRRRPLHRPHHSSRSRGVVRLRAARRRPARRALRPRAPRAARSVPTTSARTCPPHAASACRCSSSRWTRSTRSCSSPLQRRNRTDDRDHRRARRPAAEAVRAPAPHLHRRPHARRRRAAARDGAQLRERRRPRGEEAADAPRPHGRQRLLRVVHPHVVELRARGEAPLRGRHVDQGLGLGGGQGRVAEGHRAHAGRLRPGRHRHPASRTSAPRSSWPG